MRAYHEERSHYISLKSKTAGQNIFGIILKLYIIEISVQGILVRSVQDIE